VGHLEAEELIDARAGVLQEHDDELVARLWESGLETLILILGQNISSNRDRAWESISVGLNAGWGLGYQYRGVHVGVIHTVIVP